MVLPASGVYGLFLVDKKDTGTGATPCMSDPKCDLQLPVSCLQTANNPSPPGHSGTLACRSSQPY